MTTGNTLHISQCIDSPLVILIFVSFHLRRFLWGPLWLPRFTSRVCVSVVSPASFICANRGNLDPLSMSLCKWTMRGDISWMSEVFISEVKRTMGRAQRFNLKYTSPIVIQAFSKHQQKGKHMQCKVSDEYQITDGVDDEHSWKHRNLWKMCAAKYQNCWLHV